MPNNALPPNLYEFALKQADQSFETRLFSFAQFLLDTPYGSPEPNKDAKHYEDMQDFVDDLCAKHGMTYSINKLDCVTYVETALALAYIEPPYESEAQFKEAFEQNLRAIRFNYGIDTYIFSNHFTSYDWCPNNGLLISDQTKTLDSSCETAKAHINKVEFFFKTQVEKKFPEATKDYLLEKLSAISESYQETLVQFPYIKTETLLDNYDKIVNSFPEASVVNIVRPGWDLVESIGSQLNVSHQGLVFKVPVDNQHDKFELMLLHATSIEPKKVVMLPLKEYMAKYINHDTIKGINIQAIQPNISPHLEFQAQHKGYYLSKIHPVENRVNIDESNQGTKNSKNSQLIL